MSFRIDTNASMQNGRATSTSLAQHQIFENAISQSLRSRGGASDKIVDLGNGGVIDKLKEFLRRQEKLEGYKAEVSKQSPTAAKIIAEAERLGVPIRVLSDEDYESRYPGTGGVTDNGEVYIPESALDVDGDPVLEHELMHAIFGHNPEIFDSTLPLSDRIAHARDLFEGMGLDADDGERLARVTDGWPPERDIDADHTQTSVSGIDISREKAGLPPLAEAQRDELYTGAAEREVALGIQRGPLKEYDRELPAILPNSLRASLRALALAKAEAQWAATPQGRAHPPSGDTMEERAASLKAIIEKYASEDRLLKFTLRDEEVPNVVGGIVDGVGIGRSDVSPANSSR